MKRIFALTVGLGVLFTTARPVQADPIQLSLWDGGLPGPGTAIFAYTTPEPSRSPTIRPAAGASSSRAAT